MSIPTKDVPPRSTFSFYESAAWISFFIAVFMAIIVGAICFLPLFKGEDLFGAYILVFGGLVVGLIFGVISLFGFRRHKHIITLWMALIGVFISGGLASAEIVFIITILTGFGHQ